MEWIWDSKGRPERSEGKKHAGGMFFSPWENPCAFDGTPEGCWQMCKYSLPQDFFRFPLPFSHLSVII